MSSDHVIDASDAVLVVVDVQDRLAASMSRRDDVVRTIERVVRVADVLELPVVFTEQYPRGLGATVEALRAVLDGAVGPVEKLTFDCCEEPAFLDALATIGRRQVVLAGMETHICVAQTALHLLAEGYRVQVMADAVCSANGLDHDIALARLRSAGVEVTTSQAVIYEATGAAGTERFRRVLDLVKE